MSQIEPAMGFPANLVNRVVAVTSESSLGTVIGYQDTQWRERAQEMRKVSLFVRLESGRECTCSIDVVYIVPKRQVNALRSLFAFMRKDPV